VTRGPRSHARGSGPRRCTADPQTDSPSRGGNGHALGAGGPRRALEAFAAMQSISTSSLCSMRVHLPGYVTLSIHSYFLLAFSCSLPLLLSPDSPLPCAWCALPREVSECAAWIRVAAEDRRPELKSERCGTRPLPDGRDRKRFRRSGEPAPAPPVGADITGDFGVGPRSPADLETIQAMLVSRSVTRSATDGHDGGRASRASRECQDHDLPRLCVE